MASLPRRRFGEVRGGGGDDAHAEARRQGGERGVALVVEGVAVVGQLDGDPVAAEPVDQIGERGLGGFRTARRKAWRTCPLRHPVRICQCPPAASVSASKS